MPLTATEQKTFDEMFSEICEDKDSRFIDRVADLVFELTGNVNFRMRLFSIAQKLKRK